MRVRTLLTILTGENCPANIRLDEDVLKTSFVFRRCLQDVFKTSWSRPIYPSWLYVFKKSSRRFEDIFKTSCKNVFKTSSKRLAKTSSRHLQDILPKRLQDVFKTSSRRLQKRLQDIFKTSCKDAFKMFWRCIIRLNCLPSSRICVDHTFEKFMVSVENLQVW